MPSQFIAPATIQSSTLTLRARTRNFGGDRADPQEWRPRPGDPDPNRMQSALGTLNADGDFTEIIHLGDCDEVKEVTHPITGNQIKTRVRCEHWDRCKAENLARCYKAEAVAQEKQRKADFAPYIAKLLDAFHRTTTPVTFSEIAKTYGVTGADHPEYQLYRGAFYHLARTARIVPTGKVRMEGRTHPVAVWVVKE